MHTDVKPTIWTLTETPIGRHNFPRFALSCLSSRHSLASAFTCLYLASSESALLQFALLHVYNN